MFKFIFIVVVTLVIINFTSDIKVQGSLYKSEDNVFSIQFPKAEWRKEPIFYMHCQPEKDQLNQPADSRRKLPTVMKNLNTLRVSSQIALIW